MPRKKKPGPGPGRYAHLADLVRANPVARWPLGSDRCPACGGQAEFGQATGQGKYSTGRYAWFQCGSCDHSWKVDRMPEVPKGKRKAAA